MKRFLILICILSLLCSLAACGEKTPNESTGNNTDPSISESDNADNETNSTNTSAEFNKTFDFYGYTVSYADDCSSVERTGGITVTRGTDFWIVYSTPALFGEEFTVDGIVGVADKCANAVIQSVQSLQQYFDGSSATEISVKKEASKTVAGTEAVRVEGSFKNTITNKSVDYIGYYMTTNVGGSEYPIYIIGLPIDSDISVLADYLDESVKHISK